MLATARRDGGYSRGRQITFKWELLDEAWDREEEPGQRWSSLASTRIARPGRYTVRLVPEVDGVPYYGQGKRVYIQAFDISLDEVEMGTA